MKNLYIIYEKGRAASYGVGTYISQMIGLLKNRNDILVNLVELLSDKKEFQIIETMGCHTFCFPEVLNEKSGHYEIYQKNIGMLLCPLIEVNESDQLLFHINYLEHFPLFKFLKDKFPKSKTFLTIHCQMWCFRLKGNTTHFKRIIHSDNAMLLNEVEQNVYRTFLDEKKKFSVVDSIVCLAEFTKQLLIEEYHIPIHKLSLINNGVEKKKRISAKRKELIRKKWLIQPDEKILLFVGRLDEIKGLDYLIAAFKMVVNCYLNCRLIIIGDGNFALHMREAKGYWTKITFTGKLDKKEINQFYQIADIGILPSMHEQCSYTILEMMAFGLPIIGTSSTGLKEMIECYPKGDMIKIVELKDRIHVSPQEISNLILKMLNQQISPQRRSKENLYDLKRIQQDYLHLYECI